MLIKDNFNHKPKRQWDYVESMLAGNKKKLIEQMAVDGSFVAIFGEDDIIFEDETNEDDT